MDISIIPNWSPLSMTLVVISLCTVWILAGRNYARRNRLRLPPGPRGWPLIGNLPVLLQHPGYCDDDFVFSKLAREYGDIFKLRLFGSQFVYVLNNVDHVRKVFANSKIAARPCTVAKEIAFGHEAQGILFSSGPTYKAVSRFTKDLFRELGIGRGKFETSIRSEIERLVEKLDQFADDASSSCKLSELIFFAIGSMGCSTIYGSQYDYDDHELKKILDLLTTWLEANGHGGLLLTNRLLCQLPFGQAKKRMDCLAEFKRFFEDKIHESRSKAKSIEASRSFMSGYLAEIDKGERYFNESNLLACCMELLVAMIFTTKSTLSFALLYLTSHPEVQIMCQEELDHFVNDHRVLPSYSDRSKLPYMQAVILETGRHSAASPVGVPHVVEEDLEMFGYDFPKGTVVFANFINLSMNPEKFQDSTDFRPERFMEDGEFRPNPDIIPFSVGRRACIGESLARMDLFLFLTALLHRYTFTPPEGVEMPDYRLAETGPDRTPPPYYVSVTKRQK